MTYREVLQRNLGVMDAAAVAVCRDNSLPIVVFDVTSPRSFLEVLGDHSIGTTIEGDQDV